MPYLSALEVCSRQGAIQIHVYLIFTFNETHHRYSLGLLGPHDTVDFQGHGFKRQGQAATDIQIL